MAEWVARQKWKWAGHLMRVDDKIDGPRRQWSGGPEQRKGTQDDQEQDGKMTYRNWQVPSG